MPQPTAFWFAPKHKIPPCLDEAIYAVCISSDGQQVLTGGSSGVLRIWDLLSGLLKQSVNIGAEITAISWANISWRRETFWVGSADGSVMLYCRAAPSYIANGCISICSWIPVSQLPCLLHSPFSLGLKTFMKGPVESITTYRTFVAAAGDQDLQLWEVGVHSTGLKSTSVAFSLSTMPQTASGPRKPNHALLDIPLALPRSVLDGKCLHTIHFLANQDEVVLSFVDSNPAGQGSILAVYSLKPWRLVRSVTINRRVGSAAISEDGRTFAFTNLRDGIEIFSLPKLIHCGSIPQNIRQQFNVTLGIVFVGNDHIVAGESGGICMYHTTTRALVYRLQGPTYADAYRSVDALPYHKLLVAGSGDGNLMIWGWKECPGVAVP